MDFLSHTLGIFAHFISSFLKSGWKSEFFNKILGKKLKERKFSVAVEMKKSKVITKLVAEEVQNSINAFIKNDLMWTNR